MKTKFKMNIYVVVWPKGTTEEYKGEPQQPLDYEPLQCIELADPIMYYLKDEKRDVYVMPVNVFPDRDSAQAWLDNFGSSSFEVREAQLTVMI